MSNWKYGAWEEDIDISVKVFADDNYARVDILDDLGESVAKGTARRDPQDVPDIDIGIALATARAFASYANKKNRRAKGLIKHADEVLANKRLAKQFRGHATSDCGGTTIRTIYKDGEWVF